MKNLKKHYAKIFLKNFIQDLTKDISRNGQEHIEYIPTQIVTEYFRFQFNKRRKNTDIRGFIYSSSKVEDKKACVLFYDN